MKVIEYSISRPGDIPYILSIKLRSDRFRYAHHDLMISAPMVGTDRAIYDEKAVNLFSRIKIIKQSVRLIWRNNVINSNYRLTPMNGRAIEVSVPKNPLLGMKSVQKSLRKISERLGFVLCPQYPNLFRGKPTRDFCLEVHRLVVVQEVMNV